MPTLVPVDHDPFAQGGAPPQAAGVGGSPSLPQPGDPTAYGGATPALAETPDYLTNNDMRSLSLEMLAGRGSQAVINQAPGHIYARQYASKAGGNEADLKNKQNAVDPLLRRIQDFEDIGTHAGPDILGKATGPNYVNSGEYNPVNVFMPDTASEAYQSTRAFLRGGDYTKARDANLEMHHLKDAVAASFKALPGAGAGGPTDQAQRTVDSMLGAAMHSGDPQTFYKILHDAKNTLRGFARYPDLPGNPDANYVPPGFGQPPPPAGGPPPGQQGAAAPPPAAPQAASAAPPPRPPVRVMSPNQAWALPPGTAFITPDGRPKVRP